MENELQDNLDQILLDKETNLLPENLKEGVTVLGVEGSLKVTGSDSNIKLFETIDDMNSDPNPKEDDLAVVYREETQPFKEDTETQFITFPEQVVLDEPFTGNVNGMIRSVDPSVMFDGQVMLDANMFRFDGYSETGMIRIAYDSTDGINYTRTEFITDSEELTNPVDLGTVIEVYMPEEWNDAMGYFMQIGGNVFDGLYQAKEGLDYNYIYGLGNIVSSNDITYTENTLVEVSNVIDTILENSELGINTLCFKMNNILYVLKNMGRLYNIVGETGFRLQSQYGNSEQNIECTTVNMDTLEVTQSPLTIDTNYAFINGDTKWYMSLKVFNNIDYAFILYGDSNEKIHTSNIDIRTLENNTLNYTTVVDFTCYFKSSITYKLANNQFTLTSPNQILKDISAYGKNGNITGDGSITNASNLFDDISAMLYSQIQAKYDNMEPVILTNENHVIEDIMSNNIYTIPVRTDGTPLLDVSNVTNCDRMFINLKNIISIPNLQFNNINSAIRMFQNCKNITDINSIDLSNCNNAVYMFDNCNNLNTINVTNIENIKNSYAMFDSTNISEANDLNFVSAINVAGTFQYCHNLTSVNNINVVSAGKNIGNMFSNCPNLKHVDNFYFNTNNISNVFAGAGFESTSDLNIDWSKITEINNLFRDCKNLWDIYNFNMTNINSTINLYSGCINIGEIPSNFIDNHFPNVENIVNMFCNCTNLTLENNSFYCNTVKNVKHLFYNCNNIKQIDNLYLPNANDVWGVLSETSITNIDGNNINVCNAISTGNMFHLCNNLTSVSNLNIPLSNDLSRMFCDCDNLTTISNINFGYNANCFQMFAFCTSLSEIPNIQYNKINNAHSLFYRCTNITNVNVDMDLSNAKSISYLFYNSGLLNVDMNKIKLNATLNNISDMFYGCENLINVTNFNLAGTDVHTYVNLFYNCTSLSDTIRLQESTNMYNCYGMFYGCTNFKNIPNINYNNIQYCSSFMFANCRNITNIDNLNLNKINQCADMFANCINLTTISNLNLYNTVNAQWLFADCINLSNIDNIVFNRVNWLFRAFANCTNLVNAPNMKLNSCYRIESLFENCINLTNIPMYNTLKVYRCQNFVNNCPNLSNDSLNNVLQMCSNMNCMYNLKYIGLTQNQVNICMNLSNYQNFINAGWTTGY